MRRIYDWGSKNIHRGVRVERSIIWHTLFFAESDLYRILREVTSSANSMDQIIGKYIVDKKIIARSRSSSLSSCSCVASVLT
jgi:hypothetical protein